MTNGLSAAKLVKHCYNLISTDCWRHESAFVIYCGSKKFPIMAAQWLNWFLDPGRPPSFTPHWHAMHLCASAYLQKRSTFVPHFLGIHLLKCTCTNWWLIILSVLSYSQISCWKQLWFRWWVLHRIHLTRTHFYHWCFKYSNHNMTHWSYWIQIKCLGPHSFFFQCAI